MSSSPSPAAISQLAPSGTLRVALNLANFLLVNAGSDKNEPQGVAPDIGRELARRLGAQVAFVRYALPGDLAADAAKNLWDVGLIGADPLRAAEIAFTAAYLEIEAGYLVRADSPITAIDQVDRAGVTISVTDKSAYDMYLRRTIQHATLVRAEGLEGSFVLFEKDKLDVLSGLKPRLMEDQPRIPGSRILPGRFTAVQQAIGTPIGNGEGAAYLRAFVEDIKASGLVAQLIDKHHVRGVSVAAPA